jgi:hypothetical protein
MKGNAMPSRLSDRLDKLEAALAPRGRNFVFIFYAEDDGTPRAEQLAVFKKENGVASNYIIHEVKVTFQ